MLLTKMGAKFPERTIFQALFLRGFCLLFILEQTNIHTYIYICICIYIYVYYIYNMHTLSIYNIREILKRVKHFMYVFPSCN
jgi:hypothetical protein